MYFERQSDLTDQYAPTLRVLDIHIHDYTNLKRGEKKIARRHIDYIKRYLASRHFEIDNKWKNVSDLFQKGCLSRIDGKTYYLI